MRRTWLLFVLASVAACGDGGSAGSAGAAGAAGSAGAAGATADPFAPMPDTSEGLVNVSADLDAVLEHGQLAGACDAFRADPTNRRKKLLCGKWMFFYDALGNVGAPTALVEWLLASFPAEVGRGFSGTGMIADPTSPEGFPLGLPVGAKLGGQVDSRAFGCASCHFGRLPDGRYAVGAPNHDYDYGRMSLQIFLTAMLSIPGADPAQHAPEAIAVVKPLRDRMDQDPAIAQNLFARLAPLLGALGSGGMAPLLSAPVEAEYAGWRSGTMDFLIAPLPDDGVHTVSKISSLWALPDRAEKEREGLPSSWLGWTGVSNDLLDFARGFVLLGGGGPAAADYPDERLEPLVEYVLSLRAPENPAPPPAARVTEGRARFASLGCSACHDGPRGSGRRLYDYAEIGTDEAMRHWGDGNADGRPDGILLQPGEMLAGKLKSPRLAGLWAQKRFLHNGSLDSLEQLLCLAPRPDVTAQPYSAGGHTFGCDAPEADRRLVLDYLLAH